MDRRRAQEHRRWRNHGRSWIFFFGGKLLRKLLVMAPRSFTGGDRRRIVDRKHHRPWNTVTGAPSHRIAFLSRTLFLSRFFGGGTKGKWKIKVCGTPKKPQVVFGPSRFQPTPHKSLPASPACWVDKTEDRSVDNMVCLIGEGFVFRKEMFIGGATAANLVRMRLEKKKQKESEAKEKHDKRSSC